MTIELSVLPWPAAILGADGKLRATNDPWKSRFGDAFGLDDGWPDSAPELREVLTRSSAETRRVRVRVPGETAPVSLQLAAIHKAGNASEWLLLAGEENVRERELAHAKQQQMSEAASEMDGVALRVQERHWRAFFHEAAAGKSLIGLQGETLEVNRALCELLDRSKDELLNLFARDLRHPDDRDHVEAHYQAMLGGGAPVAGIEARYLHQNGQYIDCLLSLSLIRDSRERPLYFAAEVENITSWRQAQASLRQRTQELELANTELMRSNAELERFAFVVSHDLQEPLRKIRVFGDRLKTLSTDFSSDGELIRYVEVMTRSAERMQNLINDLLTFGLLRNRSPLSAVDLNELWAELREEFETTLSESAGTLQIGVLPVVQGNPARLRQLFGNLLSNALKFRGDEPPRIEVRALAAPQNGDCALQVRIEVKDNGIGFDPSHGEAIFEVFARLHGRTRYPGTGIGLAICRRIAREHGGEVHGFSLPGQGARFVVTLRQ